jgi:hypothetical protein
MQNCLQLSMEIVSTVERFWLSSQQLPLVEALCGGLLILHHFQRFWESSICGQIRLRRGVKIIKAKLFKLLFSKTSCFACSLSGPAKVHYVAPRGSISAPAQTSGPLLNRPGSWVAWRPQCDHLGRKPHQFWPLWCVASCCSLAGTMENLRLEDDGPVMERA